jgi:glycosyltransferase involved in cell wall biosynthesis
MTQRILQIIPTLDWAGGEKQACLLAARLPRDEFDVHVCALRRAGPLAEEFRAGGVPLTLIDERGTLDLHAFWQLRTLMARLRPDLIHAWTSAVNPLTQVVGHLCGVRRWVINGRSDAGLNGWVRRNLDRALPPYSRSIVVSNGDAREVCTRLGVSQEDLHVIPHGVAVPDPPSSTRRQFLAQMGLPQEARVVGWVGRLAPEKRLKDAIWAADLLKVIRDDVYLLVIGEGPLRDQLRRFRDKVLIRDKVRFIGSRSDVAQLLPHFDLLWSSSSHGGQSNVILEAMAAGVPVVATDIPGTRELVLPGTTGYLVAVGDRAGLAKYSERLLNQPALAAQLAAAARRRVASQFSAHEMVERYAELYRNLLGDKR